MTLLPACSRPLTGSRFVDDRIGEVREPPVAMLAPPELPTGHHPSAVLAELHALTAQDDWDGARRAAETILAGGEHPDEDAALGGALATLGWVAWQEGRARDAVGMLRAAVQRSELGCPDGDGSDLRLGLARMLGATGDFSQALAAVGERRSGVGRPADLRRSPVAGVVLAALHLAAGHLDQARREAEAALATIGGPGASLLTAKAELTLARVELVRGDLDQAADHAGRARVAIGDLGGPAHANCAWLEAQLIGEHDGPARALTSVDWLYAHLADHKPLLMSEPDAAVWLVRTAQAAGDLRGAEKVATVAESLSADNAGVAAISAIASHARGLLDGDAEKLGRAASAHARPWSAASASEDAGLALVPRDPEGAKDWLDGALRGFEGIGASRDAARIRGWLGGVGHRRGRRVERKVSGWASLTETEQEVAGYVAEGMTNRQVAAHLYLSRHTIDFHLRAIFRKLAVASRVELTRVVLERSATFHGGDERAAAGAS